MKKILYLIVLIFVFAGTLSAKVTLPALVGDNMVLQQQSDVKIWGWSAPNATVKITTSWGSKGSVKSDSEGNWSITVTTPAASYTSHTITVSDGEPVVIKNILIGEVWLCSGQSNMEMTFTGYWGSPVLGANQAIEESGTVSQPASVYGGKKFRYRASEGLQRIVAGLLPCCNQELQCRWILLRVGASENPECPGWDNQLQLGWNDYRSLDRYRIAKEFH